MEKLSMCRICLIENVRMHCIINTNLEEIYEKLSAMPFETKDHRPEQICYICYAKLRNCCQLWSSCLHSEKFFTQMLLNPRFQPSPLNNANTLRIMHPVLNMDIIPGISDDGINNEDEPSVDPLDIVSVPVKLECFEDSTVEISPNPEESLNAVTVQVDVHHRHCSQLSASVATTSHVCVNETQATSDVSSIHPGYPKTAAERMREYRARKKKETLTVNHKKQKRSAAERAKEYRIRKKMKIHLGEIDYTTTNEDNYSETFESSEDPETVLNKIKIEDVPRIDTDSEFASGPGLSTKDILLTEIVRKKCLTKYSRQDFEPSENKSAVNKSRRLKKMAKTSAERGREFRARKALLKQQQKANAIVEIATKDARKTSEIRTKEQKAKSAESTRRWREKKYGLTGHKKKQAKSAAQHMREYRARKNMAKKMLLQQGNSQDLDAVVGSSSSQVEAGKETMNNSQN